MTHLGKRWATQGERGSRMPECRGHRERCVVFDSSEIIPRDRGEESRKNKLDCSLWGSEPLSITRHVNETDVKMQCRRKNERARQRRHRKGRRRSIILTWETLWLKTKSQKEKPSVLLLSLIITGHTTHIRATIQAATFTATKTTCIKRHESIDDSRERFASFLRSFCSLWRLFENLSSVVSNSRSSVTIFHFSLPLPLYRWQNRRSRNWAGSSSISERDRQEQERQGTSWGLSLLFHPAAHHMWYRMEKVPSTARKHKC